jgi:3-dehydroquinate dehydratase-1
MSWFPAKDAVMLRIGDVELGRLPRVAVALSDREVRDDAKRVAPLVDVFELRIDRFSRLEPDYVAQVTSVARDLGVPLLATVRSATEGGAAALSDAERLALLRVVTPWVDAVDIELRSAICGDVVALARQHGKTTIVSLHDFDATPTRAVLDAAIATAHEVGGDIAKIATAVASPADLAILVDVLRAPSQGSLIVIGMGTDGLASRVFFPLLGSLLTWGFLNTEGAPGQLQLTQLVDELCHYAPGFARRHGRA